jgi:hypothetical protein
LSIGNENMRTNVIRGITKDLTLGEITKQLHDKHIKGLKPEALKPNVPKPNTPKPNAPKPKKK